MDVRNDTACEVLADLLALATRDESMRRTLAANAERFGAFEDCAEMSPYWRVVQSWMKNYGGDIPREHFAKECAALAEREHGGCQGVADYADYLCTRDLAGVSRRYLTDRFRQICADRADAMLRETAVTGSAEDIRKALREYDAARAIGEVPEENNPFAKGLDAVSAHMGEQRRRPLGVPFLDVAFAGGQLPGEMMLAIMPQGSGKTTLSLQGCRACVERMRHVVYIPFEQPLKGDLMRRLLVLASGGDRDDWAVETVKEGRPELVARLEKTAPLWAKYFHFIDHWQKPEAQFRSVAVLGDLLGQYRQAGIDPHLVVMDWWGVMRMMMLQMCRIKDSSERRDFVSGELRLLSAICDEHSVAMWLFHQMGGKSAAKAKPGSMYEGQEDSNLGQFFDVVMTSDRPDKSDGTISFLFDKARMGAGGTVRQKLDGQKCMFTDPPEDAYRVSVAPVPAREAADGDGDLVMA